MSRRVPTEFDADEITHLDETPALLPVDADTPEVVLVCRECGGAVERVYEGWRPPDSADAAWENWHHACVMVGKDGEVWTFCSRTGGAWVDGARRDFERRRRQQFDPYPDDRRRRPLRSSADT